MFLRLELSELESRRMKRLARLLPMEPVILWPSSRGEVLLSSPDPLSVIREGDSGVGSGGVFRSRSLLVEERRLEMLNRRTKPDVAKPDVV